MSERNKGYYWVKIDSLSKWKPMHFDGAVWDDDRDSEYPPQLDNTLYEINETRIPAPDEEKSELEE